MEPYDFNVQQIQIQDANLDSFNNVIHPDSTLIDEKTGKKPNTQQVSQSSQFAWSTYHSLTPKSQGYFLPQPFQGKVQSACVASTTSVFNKPTTKHCDLALEINQMIKDVYSEVEIPFTPLKDTKHFPDWIAVNKTSVTDCSLSKQPEHIVAQPSQVKVTHVYNQCVWSDIPSTPAPVTHLLTKSDQRKTPNIKVTDCDIRTLLQISANTSAARNYQSQRKSSRASMAEADPHNQDGNSELFESVAEALHLQQSVIGNKTITPAPPEVVAQIVADAERKLKLGQTPVPTSPQPQGNSHIHSPSAGVADFPDHGIPAPAQDILSHTLPPVPQLQDTAVTKELIRIHTQDITRSSERSPWFGSDIDNQSQHINSRMHTNSEFNQNIVSNSGPFYQKADQNQAAAVLLSNDNINSSSAAPNGGELSQSEFVLDDAQSVASSNSELETISENATESFLKSLPPFKTVNISDLMPEPQKKPDTRYSPPVKETSFRPVNPTGVENSPVAAIQTPTYQSFVTDSGVFSPVADRVINHEAKSPQQKNSRFVIPKPGPLFQSTPRHNIAKTMETVIHASNLSGQSSIYSGNHSSNIQIDEVLKEKAKLEGQLEMLAIEAQATLQERAELQAQVASLKLKFMSQKAHKDDSQKDVYKADLESLKQLRINLEQSVGDLQRQLEEKSDEGRNLQEDLNQTQELCDKLNLKLKEIRDDLKSKEMTIQALKNKVAELYVEVQVSMQAKIEADNDARSAKSDLISLQSTKDWYQQQLEIATRARSELQKELTVLQAQAVSHSSIIDRLKTENTKLRQQFSEIQNKALKEKEILAKHLEVIESDMMDREAAFQEIQRERSFIEETFNTKIKTSEDEKTRISLLMQMTTDLENQLDKAHGEMKKKQNQIVQLENENIEMMKKMSLSQEVETEKDNVIEDLKQSLIEVETRLKAFQNSTFNKDSEILQLKEDKAKTEIALRAALQEKSSVDKVLDGLKADMGKVESSFKLMRQELNTKSAEMTQIHSKNASSEEQIEMLKKELETEKRSYAAAKREFEDKSEQINELQAQKIKLESEVLILNEKFSSMEKAHNVAMLEKQFIDSELNATRGKLDEVKDKLEVEIEKEKKQMSSVDDREYKIVQEECVQLKNKITQIEKDSKKDMIKQKAKSAKLNQDLNAVKDELTERQRTFDSNIELLSGKLRELAGEKEKIETELVMTHRKYELGMLEQKDQIGTELQNLACELQQVKVEKQALEAQFIELQHARDLDLQQYQQQLAQLELELQQAQQVQQDTYVTLETNQQLMLELEKEKGRLAGLMQSNGTLKQHVSQLEEALAGRESTLIEMQTQMQQILHERESESHDNIKRVQLLEETLQKEKDGQRDIRKQIGQKITENKKVKRQNEALKQEHEQLRADIVQAQQDVSQVQSELDRNKQALLNQQVEVKGAETENKSIQRELERAQQQLLDNLAREPVIQEQIKSLQWQLELKTSELEASQHQLKQVEERQAVEIHNIKQTLLEKNGEIENLKVDISSLKLDKQQQQGKVAELRSALKSSVQHHKLTQKMRKLQPMVGGRDADSVELPPLPFDLDDMDRLLQDTTVRALESKPLDNLQNCLHNLRSEISGLQAQMDVHSNTLETSTHAWMSVEEQVEELQHVVQTITNTAMTTATTTSLASAAVDAADRSSQIIDI